MAKEQMVKVRLSGAVVLGSGRDVREHLPGVTVSVTQAVANELVLKGAGALVVIPAEASNVPVKPPEKGNGTGTVDGTDTDPNGTGTTTLPTP